MRSVQKSVLLLLLICLFIVAKKESVSAQTMVVHPNSIAPQVSGDTSEPEKRPSSDSERITALEEALRAQSIQLEEMRKILAEQKQTIDTLAGRLNNSPPDAARTLDGLAAETHNAEVASTTASTTQKQGVEDRLKNVEDRVLKIGPIRFSGDFRLRYDGTFRSASTPPDPALTHNQNSRARYRLRLNLDTDLYPTLSFHGQLTTGPINNPDTLDQDFAATTARHPFFINEAWIDYHPNKEVQLQGGRVQEILADNSRFLFDDDIRFNGFNEKYVWTLKKNSLDFSGIEFRAGQYILTNPNVAIITPGSPLANAGQVVGTIGRSANLFHQGVLFNQKFNEKWSDQFGGDVQLYRNPNQIALASTADGVVLLIQPGLGLALSGPITGTGTATTTSGGAMYSARNFQIMRFTYRLNYGGFEHDGHMYPVTFNFQFARNAGTGADERDAYLASLQVGRVAKRGDMAFIYIFARKGENSMISQVTDDDLGTGSGVNIRTNHFRFDYGLARKVSLQSLLFIQNQLKDSRPGFFVPLGAFAPTTYRVQEQLVFTF